MGTTHRPRRTALVAGAIALTASAGVYQMAELQRTARIADTARVMNAIDAADAAIAQRASLTARRERLRTTLGTTLRTIDPASRVASFVRDTARIATRHRTMIASIVPQVTPGAALPSTTGGAISGPTAGPGTSSETVALNVTVEGDYRDVLATVGDLASLTYPADVALTSIARQNPHASEATVTAAIRVTLDTLSSGDRSAAGYPA